METLVVLSSINNLSITMHMLRIFQQTLSKPVVFEGVGLHSGKKSKIKILPNDEQGILFKRVDIFKNNVIVADYKNVSSTTLSTTLMNKYGIKVSTVEHLLAALYISGIDSAIVEIDNEEVPIMDGSAKEFIDVLKNVKLKKSSKKIKYIKILEKIEMTDGNRKIQISPKDTFEVDFELNFKNTVIGKQRNIINFHNNNLKEVEESRTFCLYEDIQKIKKNGLAKGGSLENAIVVKDENVLNSEGLRNSKEFVNHKILDCIGDLFTSGYRMIASVNCSQGGHYLTNNLLRKVFEDKRNFSIIEIQERTLPHTLINRSLLRSIA